MFWPRYPWRFFCLLNACEMIAVDSFNKWESAQQCKQQLARESFLGSELLRQPRWRKSSPKNDRNATFRVGDTVLWIQYEKSWFVKNYQFCLKIGQIKRKETGKKSIVITQPLHIFRFIWHFHKFYLKISVIVEEKKAGLTP